MLRASPVRPLLADDMAELVALLDREPIVDLFVRHRIDITRGDPSLLGARLWGWFDEHDRLVSACHVGANVVPVQAHESAIRDFSRELLSLGVRPASIVGQREAVRDLWQWLRPAWGPARSERMQQPLLVIDHPCLVAPDPRVRRVTIEELDIVYPASVAMFREEVGIDPEATGGRAYRARVAHLIAQGLAFALIEDGQVLFKVEVGAYTSHACQLQGVWVAPHLRGTGLSAPALAAAIAIVRAEVSPVVSLYVNDHNVAARRSYERIGMRQIDTLASVLF